MESAAEDRRSEQEPTAAFGPRPRLPHATAFAAMLASGALLYFALALEPIAALALLPVVQLASLTGIWGVDFLLMLVPSALAVLAAYRLQRRERLRLVIGTAAACVFMLAFGAWRLSQPDGAMVRVALVAADE